MSTKSSGLITQLATFVNKIEKTAKEMQAKIEKNATDQARIAQLIEAMREEKAQAEYVIVSWRWGVIILVFSF